MNFPNPLNRVPIIYFVLSQTLFLVQFTGNHGKFGLADARRIDNPVPKENKSPDPFEHLKGKPPPPRMQRHVGNHGEIRVPGFIGWCGPGLSIACQTEYEFNYTRDRLHTYEDGLKILRDPSCFRPGKFSIVAGYYRTGSTLVFNQARLWLYLVLSFLFKKIHVSFCYIFCQQATGGENFYAGWQCDNVTQLRTEDLMCVKIVLPLRKITC
eukprot:m.62866 g.62866  ORF g.62866 m.62866 type:complete len:211 (-) comp11540_c0_seq1:888-1520(-)